MTSRNQPTEPTPTPLNPREQWQGEFLRNDCNRIQLGENAQALKKKAIRQESFQAL